MVRIASVDSSIGAMKPSGQGYAPVSLRLHDFSAQIYQVSHNEKLKKLGDENNTNLYVSGLPVDGNFNEHVSDFSGGRSTQALKRTVSDVHLPGAHLPVF